MRAAQVGITRLKRWRASFIADRRGVAAFEFVIVYPVVFVTILLPLFDVAVAAFQYISARQALHAFGQYLMYSPPDDLANTSSWFTTAQSKADELDYPINNIQIICDQTACSSANTAKPKYYTFDTTVTLAPFVLTSVLCPQSCTYTLSYSARFQ